MNRSNWDFPPTGRPPQETDSIRRGIPPQSLEKPPDTQSPARLNQTVRPRGNLNLNPSTPPSVDRFPEIREETPGQPEVQKPAVIQPEAPPSIQTTPLQSAPSRPMPQEKSEVIAETQGYPIGKENIPVFKPTETDVNAAQILAGEIPSDPNSQSAYNAVNALTIMKGHQE